MRGFIKEPERFVQVGIAEANMMGIAAGLATAGKIPFTTTFANFHRAGTIRSGNHCLFR
jgi:transketolase